LFSQRKITGSRISDAKFMLSWNAPSSIAPSPKQAATIVSRSRAFAANA